MFVGQNFYFDVGAGKVVELVLEGVGAPCPACRTTSKFDVGRLDKGGYTTWCYACDDSRYFFTLDGAVTAVGRSASKFTAKVQR